MRAMGIDMGTTTISVVLMDGESGKLITRKTIAHHSFLEGKTPASRIQDADRLAFLTICAVKEMSEGHGYPDSIGLTGQMHGVLYVDKEGDAVSPLYTWQDGSGNEKMEDGRTYAEALREAVGAAATGYGLTTHFYLQKNGLIPKTAVKMVTISDYIGMKLCCRRDPVIAKDMAASWGCFDLEKGEFKYRELEAFGVDVSYLPRLVPGHEVMGTTAGDLKAGVPVTVSLGDNQASVIGSVNSLCDTLLLNIGTGSQVSFGTKEYRECEGSIELRPCTEDVSLMVGSGLCGGRAYAMLEQFYRDAAHTEGELYDIMEKQARDFIRTYGKEAAWKIRTTFSGTRSNPAERGSITGICVENFHPGAMTVGMILGILEELHEMYVQMCEITGTKAVRLVGSGNGIRRNTLLRELAEELFGMKMQIPVCQEEAAYGAAMNALAEAGIVPSLEAAQDKIRYC